MSNQREANAQRQDANERANPADGEQNGDTSNGAHGNGSDGDRERKKGFWKRLNEFCDEPPAVLRRVVELAVLSAVLGLLYLGLSHFFTAMDHQQVQGSSSQGASQGASSGLAPQIASQLYQIFFVLVVLGGSVGAVAYWLMKSDLAATSRRLVDRRINEREKDLQKERRKERDQEWDQMNCARRLAEAKSFQGIAACFLQHYDRDFQEVAGQPLPDEDQERALSNLLLKAIMRDARGARYLADRGLVIVRTYLQGKAVDKDHLEYYRKEGDNAYLGILNHVVYHRTVERVLSIDPPSESEEADGDSLWKRLRDTAEDEEFSYALEKAQELLKRVDEGALLEHQRSESWLEVYDTAGFCLSVSTYPHHQKEGIQRLYRAAMNEPPDARHSKASQERANEVWREHNPRFGPLEAAEEEEG